MNFRMLTKNFKLVRKQSSKKLKKIFQSLSVGDTYGDMMKEDELDNIHRFLALKSNERGGGGDEVVFGIYQYIGAVAFIREFEGSPFPKVSYLRLII